MMMKHMMYVEPLYRNECIWGYEVQVEFGAIRENACPTAAANWFLTLSAALVWAAEELHISWTADADHVEIG